MGNPVGWFEIYVDDLARAQAFYESVFAVQLELLEHMDVEMRCFPMRDDVYGATGALIKMADAPVGANSVLVYFSCDDCAVEQGRIADAGGEVVQPKHSIGEHGFIATFKDTEGNLIGLHSFS